MNKSNHLIAPHLLNPVEFDGIRKSEMASRKLPIPIRYPKGFWKPLGSASFILASAQEAGR
jgi:hypothetical protein